MAIGGGTGGGGSTTYSSIASLFTAIADAIRAKKGTSSSINAQNFPSEISSISTGTSLTGAFARSYPSSSTVFTETVDGEPKSFTLLCGDDPFSLTGSTKYVVSIAYNARNYYIETVSSSQPSMYTSGVTTSYSNGVFTITLTGSFSFRTGYRYRLVYSY